MESIEWYREGGEMVEIIFKDKFCIRWRSSPPDSWTTPIIHMQALVNSWDGISEMNWFSTGHFEDGSESKIVFTVPLPMMQEIRDHILSLAAIKVVHID